MEILIIKISHQRLLKKSNRLNYTFLINLREQLTTSSDNISIFEKKYYLEFFLKNLSETIKYLKLLFKLKNR
jgi:ABC-type uncharacterized transport system substrate-binding protein